MPNRTTFKRAKYWWLWPHFHQPEDARDAAKMGVTACGLIAIVTAISFYVRYYGDDDPSHLIGGLIALVVYCAFGYGILRMSRTAATGALLLFAADKFYSFVLNRSSLGIALLLGWYLIQANRAVYWFHEEGHSSPERTAILCKCTHCGADYKPEDYRIDAPVWSCSQCHATLPRDQP